MQSYQGTVGQQVPAQPVYTLELAVGEDVAHKEYLDYTRAKQAYDDAVSDELALMLTGVTRVELFSEAVGSMDKWVRGEPAITSPAPLAACKTVEGSIEWLKDEACKQYALRVAAVEQCAELQAEVERMKDRLADANATANLAVSNLMEFKEDHQSELTKARERIAALETTGRAFAKAAAQGADSGDWGSWSAWEWDELVAFQAVLDDKDAQL